MEFTPIGFLCLAAAAIIVVQPLRLGLLVLALFIPLQTAAAVNLWSIGGMSIICAHALIGALVLGLALRPVLLNSVLRSSARNTSVVLLGLFAAYAVLSAFMMPRLFEGFVDVFSLERDPQRGIALSRLHPTSGNITQSFYITINLFLFAGVTYLLSRPQGLRRATHAFNAMTIVHLFFGAISMAPHLPPFAMLLDFIRTANYSINAHHTIAGLPRIIGSYAEPAAFGALSTGLFAWNFLRFLQTFGLWHFMASVLLLACVAISFSTTAYAVLVLLIAIWGLASVYKLVWRGLAADHIRALLCGLIASAVLVGVIFFSDHAQTFLATIYERLFGEKLQSASGLERGSWNLQSLSNFVETRGLGVGLGSARASSLVTVLLGNVGLIGALLYAGFLNRSFLRGWPHVDTGSRGREHIQSHRIFSAARAAALALLLSHIISGTNVDGGLLFFVFAATAAAAYVPSVRRSANIDFVPVHRVQAVKNLPGREWRVRPNLSEVYESATATIGRSSAQSAGGRAWAATQT